MCTGKKIQQHAAEDDGGLFCSVSCFLYPPMDCSDNLISDDQLVECGYYEADVKIILKPIPIRCIVLILIISSLYIVLILTVVHQ